MAHAYDENRDLDRALSIDPASRTPEQVALIDAAAMEAYKLRLARYDLAKFPAALSPAEKLAHSAKIVCDMGIDGVFVEQGTTRLSIRGQLSNALDTLEADIYAYWATRAE